MAGNGKGEAWIIQQNGWGGEVLRTKGRLP